MLKKTNQKGFTIIEVLIVLAIAGLILLIVFLAVPALQRSQRNNARTTDISRISAAVSDFVSNNQGQVFTAGTGQANLSAVLSSAGTLGQYTLTPKATCTASGDFCVVDGSGAAVSATTVDYVQVVTGAQCDSSNVGATKPASSKRQMAIQWAKEASAGAISPVCTNI